MASPAYTMDAAANTKCSEVMSKTYAQVTVSGAPVESNFKNDQFGTLPRRWPNAPAHPAAHALHTLSIHATRTSPGHANYQCLRKMIEKNKQYEMAIS